MAREDKSVFDDIFKQPEPEVRYFSEVMRTPAPAGRREAKRAPGDVRGDRGVRRYGDKGIPTAVKAPAPLPVQQTALVRIQHGWEGVDYLWHIEPSPRRQWKVTLDRVIYATAKAMNATIPHNVYVQIFMPYLDWEVKVVTFRAYKLRECWNVSDRDVAEMTARLFEVLGPLV